MEEKLEFIILDGNNYSPDPEKTRYRVSELTWEQVRKMHGTGRAYHISGSGRDKVMGYRIGCMTQIGDIEESIWLRLIQTMIERDGEQVLFQNLYDWVVETDYTSKGKKELEKEALELFAARIFDNTAWVDFIEFNQRYRPDYLATVEIIDVIMDCCGRRAQTTQDIIEGWSKLVQCPHCRKFATFALEK